MRLSSSHDSDHKFDVLTRVKLNIVVSFLTATIYLKKKKKKKKLLIVIFLIFDGV
jgi:glucose uptake protein GlcU